MNEPSIRICWYYWGWFNFWRCRGWCRQDFSRFLSMKNLDYWTNLRVVESQLWGIPRIFKCNRSLVHNQGYILTSRGSGKRKGVMRVKCLAEGGLWKVSAFMRFFVWKDQFVINLIIFQALESVHKKIHLTDSIIYEDSIMEGAKWGCTPLNNGPPERLMEPRRGFFYSASHIFFVDTINIFVLQ